MKVVKFFEIDGNYVSVSCRTWYYEFRCTKTFEKNFGPVDHPKLNKVLYKWMKKFDEEDEKNWEKFEKILQKV